MNRAYFRKYQKACKGVSDRAAMQMARVMAGTDWSGPMTDYERDLSRLFMAAHAPSVWYHGGAGHLGIGDILVPAKETGADPRGFGDIEPDRKHFVYITGNKKMGACFAEQCSGKLFVVRPIGEVIVEPTEVRTLITFAQGKGLVLTPELIPHLPTQSFVCDRAEIVGIEAKFWGWEG